MSRQTALRRLAAFTASVRGTRSVPTLRLVGTPSSGDAPRPWVSSGGVGEADDVALASQRRPLFQVVLPPLVGHRRSRRSVPPTPEPAPAASVPPDAAATYSREANSPVIADAPARSSCENEVPLPSAVGTVLGIEPAAEDVAGPSRSGRGKGRARLHGAEEPTASPRTRARSPLRQLVVVPRTPALQAVEDALSMALLALVLGTRPPVTPALLLQHLYDHYGFLEDRVMVRRTRPDDFIMRFSNQDDLQRVLDN